MKKYIIAHYQKSNSIWLVNGGRLIITENEYIIKCLFKTVVRFEINKTIAKEIPDLLFYKGICLTDGTKSIDLYFFPTTAKKIYKLLNI